MAGLSLPALLRGRALAVGAGEIIALGLQDQGDFKGAAFAGVKSPSAPAAG